MDMCRKLTVIFLPLFLPESLLRFVFPIHMNAVSATQTHSVQSFPPFHTPATKQTKKILYYTS
ncbi:hypothetical protein BC829DRAFT_383753, partial [Chytridium lagenaria]